jgi:acyl-CoA synthetase (NDP forming)
VVFEDVDREGVSVLLMANQQSNWITGTLATRILEAYRIWGSREALVQSADEAVQWAEEFGYPAVLKIASPDIPHKSDIGGVALDLREAEALRLAFERIMAKARAAKPEARIDGATIQPMLRDAQEVIIGVVRDEQFGPLIMFGAGGVDVEGRRDVAFGLAPLTRREAERMIEATFAGRRLRGFRGSPPADREAVIDRILRVAQFAVDFSRVAEVEINPLRVMEEGAVAIDVRMRVIRDA